jgi:hypothetical protein
MDTEQAAVHKDCFLAPIPVSMNGKRLDMVGFGQPRYPGCPWPPKARDSRRSFLRDQSEYHLGVHRGHHLVESYRYPQDSSEPTLITPPKTAASLVQSFHPGQRFLAAVGLPAKLTNALRVDVVEDGVRIQRHSFIVDQNDNLIRSKAPGYGGRGGYAVVCGSRFTKDLSQFNVVDDEVFQDALEEIKGELRQLRGVLHNNLDHFPTGLAEWLRLNLPDD